MGGFAPIEVDFEPLPEGVLGFEFIDAAEWSEPGRDGLAVPPQELAECAQAVGHGVLAALVGNSLYGGSAFQGLPFELVGLRSDEPPPEDRSGTAAGGAAVTDPRTLTAAVRRGRPLLGEEGRPPIAAAVLLRRAKYHEIDSAPPVFRTAGARAAAEAMQQVRTAPAARGPGASAPRPAKRR